MVSVSAKGRPGKMRRGEEREEWQILGTGIRGGAARCLSGRCLRFSKYTMLENVCMYESINCFETLTNAQGSYNSGKPGKVIEF